MPFVRKDPEDSKFLDLNFINLNDKKIYKNFLTCLAVLYRRFALLASSVYLQNQNLDKKYTIWNSYLYTFEVKVRLRYTLKKQDIHNW